MVVEDNHDFCDSNGIVLHNCDALRYFCYTIIFKQASYSAPSESGLSKYSYWTQ